MHAGSAVRVSIIPAKVAGTTCIHHRLDARSVTQLEALHILSNFNDDPGSFVAW